MSQGETNQQTSIVELSTEASIEPSIEASLPGVERPVRPAVGFSLAQRLVIAAVLIIISVWITSDAWRDIKNIALVDEQSSQILVVPVAVGLLLLARRRRFATLDLRASWLGPVLMGAGGAMWLLSMIYEVYSTWYAGPVVVAVGCLVTVFGVDILRKFAPAFIVLVFLIPIPRAGQVLIAQPMQDIAATVSRSVAEVIGMGVTQAGRTLRINGQDVTVAEACSGMRMIFTLFLACYMSVFSLPLKPWYRVFVLCLTPLVAIVANVVRLVLTLWAYGEFDPATADKLHTAAGWVMVLLAFFAMESIARFLDWLGIPTMLPKAGRTSARNSTASDAAPNVILPRPLEARPLEIGVR